MGLAANIGLRGIVLGIERVQVLLQPLVGRDAGIGSPAKTLGRPDIHGADPFDRLSPNPKNLGPLQRVPVIANATFVRLRWVLPSKAKPSVKTATRCICPFHSRPSMVPGLSSAVRVIRSVGNSRSMQRVSVVKVFPVVCSNYFVCCLPRQNLWALENPRFSQPYP